MKNIPFLFTMLLAFSLLFTACDDDDGSPDYSRLTLQYSSITKPDSGYIYGIWLKENDEYNLIGEFDVVLGFVTNSQISLERTRLESAQGVLISLEIEEAIEEAPSKHRIMAGDFMNKGARMTADHPDALGIDFSTSKGAYILATPTDNDTSNESSGVWFYDQATSQSTFELPTLNADWIYESWVNVGDTTISLGKFSDPLAADMSNPFGAGVNPGFPAPGGDLLQGSSIFPTELFDERLFVTVEPVPDNASDAFGIQPLFITIADTISNEPIPLMYIDAGIGRGLATRE